MTEKEALEIIKIALSEIEGEYPIDYAASYDSANKALGSCPLECMSKVDRAYTPVVCVTGGDGYEAGKIYPMMGWNNGVHILRTNELGDVVDREFCSGGYGKGFFNSFDDKGYPSFNMINSELILSLTC